MAKTVQGVAIALDKKLYRGNKLGLTMVDKIVKNRYAQIIQSYYT